MTDDAVAEPWVDEAAMLKTFQEIDTDGNGTLDEKEVVQYACKLRPERYLMPDEISKLMADLDGDGDGKVTFEEFRTWWTTGGGSLTPSEQFELKWKEFGARFDAFTSSIISGAIEAAKKE